MTNGQAKLEADLAEANYLVDRAMAARDDAVNALCDAQYEVNIALEVWVPLHDRLQGCHQSIMAAASGQVH